MSFRVKRTQSSTIKVKKLNNSYLIMLVCFHSFRYQFFLKILFLTLYFGVLGIAGGLSLCLEDKQACWIIWHVLSVDGTSRRSPFPLTMLRPWTEQGVGLIGTEAYLLTSFLVTGMRTIRQVLVLHSPLANSGVSEISWKEQWFGICRPGFQSQSCPFYLEGLA